MRTLLTSLFLLLATVAVGQTPPATTSSAQTSPDEAVLTVNGEAVLAGELDLAVKNIAAQMSRGGGEIDEEAVSRAAFQQVVDSKLLAQEARRRGIEPDAERVEQTMSQLEERAGGRDQLETALAASGLSYGQLHDVVVENDRLSLIHI